MSIDPTKETVISLRRLGLKLSEPVNKTTVYRWVKQGVKRHGTVVKLESIKMPWGVGTTMEAYVRFIRRLNK